VGGSKAGSIFHVREHESDLCTGKTLFTDRFGDSKKVRASAGEEDA
jgi:hypothetical protein